MLIDGEQIYVGWTICGHERFSTQRDIYWQMLSHALNCTTCKNTVYFIQEWKPSHLRQTVRCGVSSVEVKRAQAKIAIYSLPYPQKTKKKYFVLKALENKESNKR